MVAAYRRPLTLAILDNFVKLRVAVDRLTCGLKPSALNLLQCWMLAARHTEINMGLPMYVKAVKTCLLRRHNLCRCKSNVFQCDEMECDTQLPFCHRITVAVMGNQLIRKHLIS